MTIKDKVVQGTPLYVVILTIVMVYLGAYYIFTYPQLRSKNLVIDVKESAVGEKVEIPIEIDGIVVVRIYAEEALFVEGEPVKFVKPIIYHYGEEHTTKISGDNGELYIKDNCKEIDFSSMKVYGNLHIEQQRK